jgi:hypothetical protein
VVTLKRWGCLEGEVRVNGSCTIVEKLPFDIQRKLRDISTHMCNMTRKKVRDFKDIKEDVVRPWEEDSDDKWMRELKDESDIVSVLGEAGCPICETQYGRLYLGPWCEPDVGAGCNIDEKACERRGDRHIGTFHTHPLGGNTPSPQDMDVAFRGKEEMFCIGGKVGGKPVVSCYIPNMRAKIQGPMAIINPFVPTYPMPDVESYGKIHFWRQTPPPTATDILETKYSDEDMAEWGEWQYNKNESKARRKQRIAEYKEQLSRGEIPEDYWQAYWEYQDSNTEGDFDSIDVFEPKHQAMINKQQKDMLRRDYNVVEVACNQHTLDKFKVI